VSFEFENLATLIWRWLFCRMW